MPQFDLPCYSLRRRQFFFSSMEVRPLQAYVKLLQATELEWPDYIVDNVAEPTHKIVVIFIKGLTLSIMNAQNIFFIIYPRTYDT